MGRAFVGDGLATMLSGSVGGSGVTTYAENIGVMAVTKVYSTLVFVAAALIAMLLGFAEVRRINPHHSRAGDRRRLDRGLWLNCRRRGADLGAKPGGSESKQQFDHGVGDPVLGAGDFALSLGGFTLGGLARPPSGRSCCTRCFIAGRARRRRRGNAGVSHISAALAQGAVWAWCDPVGRIRHLCRHPAPPRARNLTARRRCACRAWRLPRPSGNVSAILRPSAPAVSATMVNKLTAGRTNVGRVRRSRHPA